MEQSTVDMQTISQMQEEFKKTYDEKAQQLQSTYQQCLGDLTIQYNQQADTLEVMYQNALKNHNQILQEQNDAFQKAEQETAAAAAERSKIQLESKNLKKMKVAQDEMLMAGPAVVQPQQEAKLAQLQAQQQVSAKSSASSTYGNQPKKKAADFYFQKGKQDEQVPKASKKNQDFIQMGQSASSAPARKSLTTKATPGFTYDRPTESARHRQKAKQIDLSEGASGQNGVSPTRSPGKSPINSARNRNLPSSPVSWKKNKKQISVTASVQNPHVQPHKAYVPPALAKAHQTDSQNQPQKTHTRSLPATALQTAPQLPEKLIDEFKSTPRNYQGVLSALQNEDNFNTAEAKWKQLGVLYAEDVIRNAPAHCPIDYQLRVSENDTQSGFGQVDKNGKLQGLGREVHDFIYEGQFKDNVYHGWGRYISHLGVYWGAWNNGLRHGQGKFISVDGQQKEGNWNNGILK